MGTKGASNHYGNTKNGKQGHKTAHIGFAWAKDFNKNTLAQHFAEHGFQMGCSTPESYAAHAVSFCNTIDKENCISFVAKNGSTYKYNRETNTLAIISKKGYVITYYKPKDGYSYYQREKMKKQKRR